MTRRWTTLALIAWFLAGPLQAADEKAEKSIREALSQIDANMPVGEIERTPVEGLYSVVVGAQVFYVTADGQYLLQGELVDLEQRRSLTEDKRKTARLERIAAVGDENMLIFEPKGKARHEVTVFTDIDCPYCRRLHQHMAEYTERGIRVRYLLMPRAGVNSNSYDKAVWAWCSEDPQDALTRAKQGKAIAPAQCDNPVKDHLALAQELGIRATPSIITENGTLVSGYRDPEAMSTMLERDSQGLPVR